MTLRDKIKIMNYKTGIIVLIAFSVGIVLIYFSDSQEGDILSIIGSELGGLIIVSFGISFIWELFAKRNFLEEILEKMNIKKDIHDTRIIRITDSFRKITDDEWHKFFENLTELDIFVCYARTWIKNRLDDFEQLKIKKKCKIRIVLPNINNKRTITELSKRFKYGEDKLKEYISDTLKSFKDLKKNGLNITIKEINEPLLYSTYRFDDKIIFAAFTHRDKVSVPALIFKKGGSLYEYYKDEFEVIINKPDIIDHNLTG